MDKKRVSYLEVDKVVGVPESLSELGEDVWIIRVYYLEVEVVVGVPEPLSEAVEEVEVQGHLAHHHLPPLHLRTNQPMSSQQFFNRLIST